MAVVAPAASQISRPYQTEPGSFTQDASQDARRRTLNLVRCKDMLRYIDLRRTLQVDPPGESRNFREFLNDV